MPPFHRRCLVIVAPHPDDDILGCSRLLAAARRARWRVAIIALTDGQASHPNSLRWPARDLGRLRRAEMRRALARLGAASVPLRYMGWRDGSLAADGSSLRLRFVLRSFGATDVAVASPRDHHPDHKAAWLLARAATAQSRSRLHAYEVWARTDAPVRPCFAPGKDARNWAMRAHRSQVTPYIADDPDGFVFDRQVLRRILNAPETLTFRRGQIGSIQRPQPRLKTPFLNFSKVR